MIVSRPTAARTEIVSAEDLDVLEEHLSTLYQVLGRLCTPDEDADMAGANPDVVCMTGVQ